MESVVKSYGKRFPVAFLEGFEKYSKAAGCKDTVGPFDIFGEYSSCFPCGSLEFRNKGRKLKIF